MKYPILIVVACCAIFMTGCDTNGNLGHGWGVFGIASQDSEGNGRGGSAGGLAVEEPEEPCFEEVVVEQRCFNVSKWIFVRCAEDCGQDNDENEYETDEYETQSYGGGRGHHRHWCWVRILSLCDLQEIRCLLGSENGWRIQGYVLPCGYNPCDPEWFYVEVGDGLIIDIRNGLVLERVELRECNQPE